MTVQRTNDEASDAFVESASMKATFLSVKRTLLVGLVTAGVVVAGLLLSGGASVRVTLAVVGAMMASRVIAAWTASEGLKAETLADQRRWTQRLDITLVPLGALSGLAPIAVPRLDGQVSPEWFGLLVCSVAVVAANVLIGHGRSRTFLALTLPLVLGSAVSALLAGGEFALFFAPGGLIVGAILMMDNHEAGSIFRDARRLEEENRTLVSELQAANSSLEHRVHTDVLTGLDNRAGLRQHIASLEGTAATVEVMYIDLDGFKAINDEYGHAAGDAVLVAIGERLGRVIRADDCAARLGGDEFAVIAAVESRVSDTAAPSVLAARVRSVLAQPILVGDNDFTIGASLGLQRAEPGDDIGRALRLADASMYRQKRRRPDGASVVL